MSPNKSPSPDSPYGASKIFMEILGKYYATKGLEVICIRFGGVNPDNKPPEEYHERIVWLSHRDCIELIKKCVETSTVPNNYLILYGISNNKNRVHDYSNPLGWIPQDDSESFQL